MGKKEEGLEYRSRGRESGVRLLVLKEQDCKSKFIQMPPVPVECLDCKVVPHNLFLFLPQFLRGTEASPLSMLQTCGL